VNGTAPAEAGPGSLAELLGQLAVAESRLEQSVMHPLLTGGNLRAVRGALHCIAFTRTRLLLDEDAVDVPILFGIERSLPVSDR